jgi:hypothetical protein
MQQSKVHDALTHLLVAFEHIHQFLAISVSAKRFYPSCICSVSTRAPRRAWDVCARRLTPVAVVLASSCMS